LGAVLFSLVLIFTNDTTQLQTVRAWTFEGFGLLLDKLTFFREATSLYQENRWLRQKNTELMLQNSRLKEAWLENQRLRQMLAFKSESQLDLTPAKVIGIGGNEFIHSVILSVGSVDGVRKNMPVVTAQGLVGKIYSEGSNYATAQLLLDRNSKVSAMIQRSRVTGIINWYGGNQLILVGVPKRSDVKVGDAVVTSGYSSIFPGGLKIGLVTRITEEVQDMFMKIIVKPVVDFTKLEEVFVIKNRQSSSQRINECFRLYSHSYSDFCSPTYYRPVIFNSRYYSRFTLDIGNLHRISLGSILGSSDWMFYRFFLGPFWNRFCWTVSPKQNHCGLYCRIFRQGAG
jgi:rod shape-determining protein MreC